MQHAVHHVRRPGVTRDLPYGPEDLFWVVNTATLVCGERDAVLAGPRSVGSFWERLLVTGDVAYNDTHQYLAEATTETRAEWAATADRLRDLNPATVVPGHQNPDRPDDPVVLAETAAYLRDFNALDTQTKTAEDSYGAMLQRYPRRANPGSLWGGARRAKQ
jgi:hypothetical protein